MDLIVGFFGDSCEGSQCLCLGYYGHQITYADPSLALGRTCTYLIEVQIDPRYTHLHCHRMALFALGYWSTEG